MQLVFVVLMMFGVLQLNAQNDIDFTKEFNTMTYMPFDGGAKNGLNEERFSGSYRIYSHAGLRIGFHIKVLPNPNRKYTYKGITYTPLQIPELNEIAITRVAGTLRILNSSLSASEKERKLEISIGGYLDNSGSLGGNNIEITSQVPKQFSSNTPVSFSPTMVFFDANKVHIAIEKHLQKEKEKEADKANQDQYARLLHEADALFASGKYDQALNKYYLAKAVYVADKDRAEEGIRKTRKAIEEEKVQENAKTIHTYKSGECRLGGTAMKQYTCPQCIQQQRLEAKARTKENERVDAVKHVRLQLESKKREEERLEKERIAAESKKKEEATFAEDKKQKMASVSPIKSGTKNQEIWRAYPVFDEYGHNTWNYGYIKDTVRKGLHVSDSEWKIKPMFYSYGKDINNFTTFRGDYCVFNFDRNSGTYKRNQLDERTNMQDKSVIIDRQGRIVMETSRAGDAFDILGNDSHFAVARTGETTRRSYDDISIIFIDDKKKIFTLPPNDEKILGKVYWSYEFIPTSLSTENLDGTRTQYYERIMSEISKYNSIGCFIYNSGVGREKDKAILLRADGSYIEYKDFAPYHN